MVKFITKTVCIALIGMLCVGSVNAQRTVLKQNGYPVMNSVSLTKPAKINLPLTKDYTEISYATGMFPEGGSLAGWNFNPGMCYGNGCIHFTHAQLAAFGVVGGALEEMDICLLDILDGSNPCMQDWTSVKIWIKTSLAGAVVYDQDVTSQVTVGDWNYFELTTPYTITEDDLVLGYTIAYNMPAAAVRYPILKETGTFPTGACYTLGTTNANGHGSGASWSNGVSGEYGGALTIFGIVNGGTPPPPCDGVASNLAVAYATDCSTATLTWDVSDSGDYTYDIYRDNAKIATVDATTYTDNTFNPYMGHTWKVVLKCLIEDKDPITVTKDKCDNSVGTCDPATNLVVDFAPNCTTAELTWDEPTGTKSSRGMVNVTLKAGDVWGDGSGYQLLLDETATQYGTGIPTTGQFCTCAAINPNMYDIFSHTIPAGCYPECASTSGNWIFNNEMTIQIPAGTYDYCIVNPEPGNNLWIAGGDNGRKHNYVFAEGKDYLFEAKLNGQNDQIVITITDAPIYEFTYNIYRDDNLIKANHYATTYTDNDFFAMDGHTWEVVVVCDDGRESEPATAVEEACGDCKPPVDIDKMTQTGETCMMRISWKHAENNVPDIKYRVYRNGELLANDNGITDLPGNTTSFLDKNVDTDVEYTWVVKTLCPNEIEVAAEETVTWTCVGEAINELTNSVAIYPNPANGTVTIDAKDFAKVEVYNTVGQLVETKTVNSVDVSNYNTGVYFFKVYDNNNNNVTKRVMVTK